MSEQLTKQCWLESNAWGKEQQFDEALSRLAASEAALKEAQEENRRLRVSGVGVSGLLIEGVVAGTDVIAGLECERDEAQQAQARLKVALGDWPADAHSEICAFLKDIGTGRAVYSECNCGYAARETMPDSGWPDVVVRAREMLLRLVSAAEVMGQDNTRLDEARALYEELSD